MENIQNMQPNCPELAQLIRQNLSYQNQQSIKKTLFKQSVIKISLDKDFQHIFNHQPLIQQSKPLYLQVTPQIKKICEWLEQSNEFSGLAYLTLQHIPKLYHILHQKVQKLVIIVTQYHSYWQKYMQQMDKLANLKWAFLTNSMTSQEKIKVLQLYELKQLKLLFISPSLLKVEDYHEFECDLLVFQDVHHYAKSQQFFYSIAKRTSPGRILSLHNTLNTKQYNNLKLTQINIGDQSNYNFIALKTTPSEKLKTVLGYINKNNFQKVLILANRSQIPELNKKLLIQSSYTVFNLPDHLSQSQIYPFTIPELLNRSDKKQQKILEYVHKASYHNICLSTHFDALRFGGWDAVIYFNFIQIDKFLDYIPQAKSKLMLLVEQDYFNKRNNITSDYLAYDHLNKIIVKLMQKKIKKQQGFKRCYSQHLNDQVLESYSTRKQLSFKNEQKVVKVNWFCKFFDVSPKVLNNIIQSLQKNEVVKLLYKIPYEIQIQQQSLQLFRKLHPKATEIRRKVNVLGLSTCLQRTTTSILSELRLKDLKYKITEEALQLSLLKDYQDVDWIRIVQDLNSNIRKLVSNLDQSYELFKQHAYHSMELTRRQKVLNRTDKFINFALINEQYKSVLQTSHKINLLSAELEEWFKNYQQKIDEHELILILQGVDKSKMNNFKKDPIYGRYRKFKYEQLLPAVQKFTKNKKVKL